MRGKVSYASLLAAAAVFMLAVGCGCEDKSISEVRAMLREANAHISEFQEQMKDLAGFKDRWNKALSSGAGTADMRNLLASAQKSIEVALRELRESEKSLGAVKGMKISPEMEKYVSMKMEALEEDQKWLELELLAMPLRFQLIDMSEQGATIEEVVSVEQQISDLEKEAAAHRSKAGALHRDANDYYDEQKLSR